MSPSSTKLLVIRMRGGVNASRDELETFKLLHLSRNFHATILTDSAVVRGMLQKVKDHITWGEVSEEAVEQLLVKRGRVEGGRRLTEELAREVGFESIRDLAKHLIESDKPIAAYAPLKPVFRLHPPKGGFKGSTKKSVKEFGELGYRGKDIAALLSKMI